MSIRKIEKVNKISATKSSTGKTRDERKSFKETLQQSSKRKNFDVLSFSKNLDSTYNNEKDERDERE